MSGEAQIIKRVRSRASRTRDTSPPVSDSVDDPPSSIPDTLATKLKNKQKRSKPKSRLSFGTDDQSSDTEIFKVKKSSLSQKLTLNSDASPTRSSALSNHDQASLPSSSSGPSYTQAYINELKARMPSSPVVHPPVPQSILDVYPDVVSEVTASHGDVSNTTIADDFISLSVVAEKDTSLGPHPDSRLVREEDELGEGEDDMAEYTGAQERIALGAKARRDDERKRKIGMIEMIKDAEEEDEEISEWERAQIRRAGHVDEKSLQSSKATYRPAPVPSVISLPVLTTSMTRLTDSIKTITLSHASHLATLSSLADERSVLESRGLEMRRMIEKTERKRGWFVAFRGWMEGVASLLHEKYPSLEALDDEHVSLLSERNDMISKRRRLDDEDDIALLRDSLSGVMPDDEDQDSSPRSEPLEQTTPITRRSARSHRRLLRRAQIQNSFISHEEGYSTDGSLDSADADDFRTAINKLEERRKDVLSDVQADDFRDPQLGLARWFGEWREMYAESYERAWGGLGLVAAWEFWSRLEMVGWNPIEDDSRDLSSFEWFVALHDYSRAREESGLADVRIADVTTEDMVSSMISQVVIPRLCKLVTGGALDPYSEHHIRRTIDIAEQVEASTEQEGVRYQMLLRCVSTVFCDAVASTRSPWSSDNRGSFFDPKVGRVYRRLLVRRLKLLNNLLKWRKYTGERFGLGEAATSLVKSFILPLAAKGWEIGGKEILRKTVENMPTELVPAEVTKRLE